MSADARGEVELDGDVLVIRRISVTYHLEVAEEHRDTVQRVLRVHADHCPVARTLRNCVAITTQLAEA